MENDKFAEHLREVGDMDDKYHSSYTRSDKKKDWHIAVDESKCLSDDKRSVPKLRNDITSDNSNGSFNFQRDRE